MTKYLNKNMLMIFFIFTLINKIPFYKKVTVENFKTKNDAKYLNEILLSLRGAPP